MANTVTLDFAGDATKLQRAAAQSDAALAGVGSAARDSGGQMNQAAQDSDRMASRMGALGSATTGATDAIGGLAGGLQAAADAQDFARATAAKLERANIDVAQATEDAAQANRDLKQSAIDSEQAALDLEQAKLDEKTALEDYNKAVKEHGKNSDEAKQAQIDLKQAGIDVKQAQEDSAQALRDGSQAAIDARTAQLDLSEAQHEAKPPELQQWADKLNVIAPLLTALVGVVSLVTMAQTLWNLAMLASPLTWIIIAIVAVIAVIVLIATKTTWFQTAWKVAWGGIKAAASAVGSWFRDTLWGGLIRPTWDRIKAGGQAVWDWMKKLPGLLKDAFSKVTNFIFAPFRAAFNLISDAWNNTIGRLSWSVPGWVPGIGGNSISVPNLPKFHTGGVVPGRPGQEVPIMALAGERVTPANRSGEASGPTQVVVKLDSDVLMEGLARSVKRRGGGVQLIVGTGRG